MKSKELQETEQDLLDSEPSLDEELPSMTEREAQIRVNKIQQQLRDAPSPNVVGQPSPAARKVLSDFIDLAHSQPKTSTKQ